MHHSGGSGGRKNAVRCATVRQRGITFLALDVDSLVSAKSSHSRAVFFDTVTMRLPLGLNLAVHTGPSCPFSSRIGLPVSISQSFTVGSRDAVRMRLPSRLNSALRTLSR